MSSEEGISLGSATHQVPTDRRQLLCLSGGGFRGLYTAIILEELERRAGRPLCDVFDVIAGSSIGAWIATALALRIPTSEIRTAIVDHGPSIFNPIDSSAGRMFRIRNPLRFLFRPRYNKEPVRRTINSIFGEYSETPLSELDKPLILSAVDVTNSSPAILLSRGLAGQHASALPLRDALLATAAAPTYFPTHYVAGSLYVDGGMVANAPDLVAITTTIRYLGTELQHVRVLSVGTAASLHTTNIRNQAPGLIHWLIQHGLVQLTLSAQEQLAVEQSEVLLRDRYLRLDHKFSESDQYDLPLDNTSLSSIDALERAAQVTIRTMSAHNHTAVRRILSHQPKLPRRAPLNL